MIRIAYVPRLLKESNPETETNSIHGYFLQNRHVFEKAGITLDLFGDSNSCDIAWIGNAVWDENLDQYSNLPLIQDLVVDDSWLSTRTRKVLNDERVIGLTRGAGLSNLEDYKGEFFDGSYHGKIIRDATPDAFPDAINNPPKTQTQKLEARALQKMIPSPGFLHILRHGSILDWAKQNPIFATGGGGRFHTCHFAGAVEFRNETISKHRQLACAILANGTNTVTIPTKLRSSPNRMSKGEYLNTLRQSKVCVSPWGYGERCHRDYEAILSGCVLVKPDTSHLVMYPDMFHPDADIYVRCKVDFSDLPEIIQHIEQNWNDYHPMRVRAYTMLMESIKPEVAIPDLCSAIIEKYSSYLASERNVA